jgi:riboflavin synthase
MFTGLIEELGAVRCIEAVNAGTRMQISAPQCAGDVRVGDSVAVNGCCLTVYAKDGERLVFDLLRETVERTNLNRLQDGSRVNLERALRADARLGGHFVQGHIDCTAAIISFEQRGADYRLELELPRDFAQYIARKGSIAIDGISLTVAEILPQSFAVWIIPHTKQHTNLHSARAGDLVNLEFDVLAKYVERMLGRTVRS